MRLNSNASYSAYFPLLFSKFHRASNDELAPHLLKK